MKMVFGLLRQYAAADAPVLIEGETGTGKELAARAIHDLSARAGGPYEILDCGAVPDHLLEAELFGVERGAYTGAHAARAGIFERATGGTVVLDEVGALPLELQPSLLGVLERGQVRRLGGERPHHTSARVIAITNRLLSREVQAGRFRQDLFFRLSVLRVTIPPLRQRPEDVPLLITEILGSAKQGVSASWLRMLEDHEWPGNVRELKNALLRAQAVASRHGPEAPIDPVLAEDGPALEDLETARRRFEQDYLRSLLAKAGTNIARAARVAGVTRQGLYQLLRRNGLKPRESGRKPRA
jgi:DNA-binding NtrC family response regulator